MQDNQDDLELLKDNPVKLLMKYQQIFTMITRRYARCGYFQVSDCDDILQHVNEQLLRKVNKIQCQYDGRVLVRTYLSVICRNAIREHLRMVRKRNLINGRGNAVYEPQCVDWQNSVLFILDEFQRFEKIMHMLGSKKHKILLIMKLIYRIKVDLNDFKLYHAATLPFVTPAHLDLFNKSTTLKDKDIYRLLLPIMQQAGALINHPDTIRRWFNHKTDEIIIIMNGNPVRSYYTSDTLQILIEKYYAMVEAGTYTPVMKL